LKHENLRQETEFTFKKVDIVELKIAMTEIKEKNTIFNWMDCIIG
jgi:hypothetical protein